MPPNISQSDVTYVVLPDTQYYAEQDNGIFEAMTQWIADNQSTYNIEMVLHEGDVVNNPDSSGQWSVAETAIGTLDSNNIPSLITQGNHDANNLDNPSIFRSHFSASRYSDMETNHSSITDSGSLNGNSENSYLVQEVNGAAFLYLTLKFGPSQAAIEWASGVIDSYPDAYTVIVTHSYLYHTGELVDSATQHSPSGYSVTAPHIGLEIWNELLSQKPSMRAVHSGHHINGPYTARRSGVGDSEAVAAEQFMNYQDVPNGGDGWLRLVTVDTDTLSARVNQYSPHLDEWNGGAFAPFSFSGGGIRGAHIPTTVDTANSNHTTTIFGN